MEVVVEAAGHQVEIAARQPEHQQGRVRRVVHGVLQRDLGRQRRTRLGRRDRLRWDGECSLDAGRGLEPLGATVSADHEAAE